MIKARTNPKPALPLKERDITKQIKEFLEWQGWRAVRMQSGLMSTEDGRYVRIGERGMPDWLFLHYEGGWILWVEMKAPKGKRSETQFEWAMREEARGGTVLVASDFDAFRRDYYRLLEDLQYDQH